MSTTARIVRPGASLTTAQTTAGATGVPGLTSAGVMSNLAGTTVATLTSTAATFPGTLVIPAARTSTPFAENPQAPSIVTLSGDVARSAPPVVNSVGSGSFLGYANTSSVSWSENIATVNCTTNHNYRAGQLFTLASVVPSGYNTTGRIIAVPTATTYTFALASNPGTYTSGGFTVLHPEAQIRPSGPRTPAMALCSDPDAVSLGYDDVPLLLITDSDGNRSNKSIQFGVDGHTIKITSGGNLKRFMNGVRDICTGDFIRGWTNAASSSPDISANVVLGYGLSTDGSFEVNNGTLGTFRDARVRTLTQKPVSSVTPATNGDLVFEATSNTVLTIKYRGSDGIVRTTTLALI